MKRSFTKGICLGFAFTFLACSLFVWLWVNYNLRTNQIIYIKDPEQQISYDAKRDLLLQYIDEYYYNDYDMESLYDKSLEGLVEGLGDKYSEYYTPEVYQGILESNTGNYYGIGAYVGLTEGGEYAQITSPISGSPAEKAGLLPGDILLEVDGESIYKNDLDTVVSKIKGQEGTEVTLTIKREGEAENLNIVVIRGKVEIPTVDSEMLDNNIGYIVVSQFDAVTVKQFDEAVDSLTEAGMTSLIIDLRNNPGGLLDTANKMLDRILPSGKLLVYTEDKKGNREEFFSKDDDKVEVPIAIIINGNSASASEVFTGCLRDYGNAVIVGTTSYGKGIVQTIFSLPDGSRIKLTTSSYFSPNGNNIHGVGITPDVEIEIDYNNEEDEQLQAAIDALSE